MLKDMVASVSSDVGSYTKGVGTLLNKEGWVDSPSDIQPSNTQVDIDAAQSRYVDIMQNQYLSVFGNEKLSEVVEKPLDVANRGFSDAMRHVTDGFKDAGIDYQSAVVQAENRPSVSNVSPKTTQPDADKSKVYFERARMAFEHGASDGLGSDFDK